MLGLALLFAVTGCSSSEPRLSEAPRLDPGAPLDPQVAALIEQRATAVDTSNEDPEAWAALARAYHANEVFDLAERSYRQALARDESRADWWYLLARVEQRRGNFEPALAAMDRSLAIDDGYVHSWWRRGDWQREIGELDAADDSYGRALELDPASFLAQSGRAHVMLDRGERDQAIARLEELIRSYPDEGFAHFLLGNAYREAGRDADAARHLELGLPGRVVRDDRWSNELLKDRVGFGARVSLANQYLTDGQLDSALQLFEALRRERPDDVRVLGKVGSLYLRLGRHDEARDALAAAVEADGNDVTALLELAGAHRALGNAPESLRWVERAIEVDPTRPSRMRVTGRCWTRRGGCRRRPRRTLRRCATTRPTCSIWQAAGDCLAKQAEWPGRRRALRSRAAARRERRGPARPLRGRHCSGSASLEQAETVLRQALTLGPRRPDQVEGLLEQIRVPRKALGRRMTARRQVRVRSASGSPSRCPRGVALRSVIGGLLAPEYRLQWLLPATDLLRTRVAMTASGSRSARSSAVWTSATTAATTARPSTWPRSSPGGAALFDMDDDGDLDAYLVQSGNIVADPATRLPNRLFENTGATAASAT